MTANLLFIGFHGAADRSTPESQNELLARLLADAGYQVRSASAQPRQLLRFADQMRVLLANLRWADAVVACQFSGRRAWTTFFLTRITRRASIPTLIVLRGGSLPEAVAAHPKLIDSTVHLATRVLAPSSYLQGAFEERGHRVQVVPNYIRASLTAEEPSTIDGTEPKILWMRAFHPVYQPELAVQAFAGLLSTRPGAHLTMAGPDRGLLGSTRDVAQQLGILDRVTFPGYLEEDAKATAFRDHDIFLNTTLTDNTPVSVIEAMGAKLPVVATDVGGMRDLAPGGDGILLVPDGDPAALADALANVIADPVIAASLRDHGLTIAERHGVDEVLSAWTSLLSEVGAPLDSNPRDGCAPLSFGDVAQVVALHLAAFEDSGLSRMGTRVVRRYYQWQFSGPHPDPVAIGSWRNGELVGFVFGGARHQAVAGFVRTSPVTLALGAISHPSFLRRVALPKVAAVGRAILGGRRHPSRPVPRAQPVAPETGAPSFGILSIAVDARYLGTEVASELIDAAEREARLRGFGRMNLSVNTENARAVGFYEKSGWVRSGAEPWDGRLVKDLSR